jgi:hypothetical protein
MSDEVEDSTKSKKSAMEDRLYVKQMVLHRNIFTGNMEVKSISTNKGDFLVHEDVQTLIDSEAVNNFYDYIRSIVVPHIKGFLEQEQQEKGELLE